MTKSVRKQIDLWRSAFPYTAKSPCVQRVDYRIMYQVASAVEYPVAAQLIIGVVLPIRSFTQEQVL